MHETALMQNLISTAARVLEDHHAARVNCVAISVGRLANALPDALLFAFEALTQDGIMRGAKLDIECLPALARCDGCGCEYQADGFPLACPVCGSQYFRIISGEEVCLKSIEYEEE